MLMNNHTFFNNVTMKKKMKGVKKNLAEAKEISDPKLNSSPILYEKLQASSCVYKSQGAPARGIGSTPVKFGRLQTNIASRLTLPKLCLATYKEIFNDCKTFIPFLFKAGGP